MWALLVKGLPDCDGGFQVVGPFASEKAAILFADGDDETHDRGHFTRSLVIQMWTPEDVVEYHDLR